MIPLALVAVLAAAAGGLSLLIASRWSALLELAAKKAPVLQNEEPSAAWRAAEQEASEKSAFTQALFRISRKLMRQEAVRSRVAGAQMTGLQRMLLEAGSPYGGSTEVFVGVVAAHIVIALMVVVLGITFLRAIPWFAFLPLGVVISMFPFLKTRSAAKKRAALIRAELPDFADLLLVILSAGGVTLTEGLKLASFSLQGVLSSEVRRAVQMTRSGGMALDVAINNITPRLGVVEARIFFGSISQSEQEGTGVLETLARQRQILWDANIQRARAHMKKMPLKMTTITLFHIMPTVQIAAMAALISGLTHGGFGGPA